MRLWGTARRGAQAMTGNVSKARREALLKKIREIRAFIEEAAAGDENAARLLEFADDIEREARGAPAKIEAICDALPHIWRILSFRRATPAPPAYPQGEGGEA